MIVTEVNDKHDWLSSSSPCLLQVTRWFPDHLAAQCYGCESRFWLATRRHHCRSVQRRLLPESRPLSNRTFSGDWTSDLMSSVAVTLRVSVLVVADVITLRAFPTMPCFLCF